jgi:hypothetical protein
MEQLWVIRDESLKNSTSIVYPANPANFANESLLVIAIYHEVGRQIPGSRLTNVILDPM